VAYVIGFTTLKIRQDFCALVTFGFGEALRAVMDESVKYTGGAWDSPGSRSSPRRGWPSALWRRRLADLQCARSNSRTAWHPHRRAAAQVIGINSFAHKLRCSCWGRIVGLCRGVDGFLHHVCRAGHVRLDAVGDLDHHGVFRRTDSLTGTSSGRPCCPRCRGPPFRL